VPWLSAVAHDFEQVAVEIKEIHAIMIAPVDWRRTFDPGLREPLARSFEIVAAHLERMMAFAQRMRDAVVALLRRERRAFYLEQRQILRPTLEQRLIAQMGDDRQSQHFGIKMLGRCELVNFDPKMVELFKFHQLYYVFFVLRFTGLKPVHDEIVA
jgi:hypothetical protein